MQGKPNLNNFTLKYSYRNYCVFGWNGPRMVGPLSQRCHAALLCVKYVPRLLIIQMSFVYETSLSLAGFSGQYIWIKTLIDILKDYRIYYFSGKSIAIIHLRNQNNNSCDVEQMEYKISEFQIWSIFGKTLRPFINYT